MINIMKLKRNYTLLIVIGMIGNSKLHWNNLEWVNPISKTKSKKNIQYLQRNFIIINILERIIGLDIQN